MLVEFEGFKPTDGGVCAAEGFTAGGVNAQIKHGSTKNDIAIIHCVRPCSAAALYTKNKVKGAPILVTQKHLANGIAQAVIVNSGNANTCNSNGVEIAEKMCELTAQSLGIKKEDVVVASTGVIGQKLSIKPFEQHIPSLSVSLSKFGSGEACSAIMTTDTRKKEFAVEFSLGGKTCHVGGISKGSGMINPNMATFLAFITTDVDITPEMLETALRTVNAATLNRVSVDGDTSTNDMVCIMASGIAGNAQIAEENDDYEVFVNALQSIMVNMARETARDGEGATKLIECVCKGAPSEDAAEKIAKSVISSSLLKAAFFAADANWGRILCAIGYADAEFDISKAAVELKSSAGSIKVCENGAGVDFSEETAYEILSEDEILVSINMGDGSGEAVAWGCDLTYDYVKINAEYRS